MKLTPFLLTLTSIGTCWAQFGVQIHAAGPLPGGPFKEKVVTGKPFTATAEMESDQTLANGSHITSKHVITVARDSQGRTRREETLPPPPGDGPQLKTVFISDPVAQANYVLGPDNVAHKFTFLNPGSQPQGHLEVHGFNTAVAPPGEQGMSFTTSFKEEPGDSTTESLGTQTISGVQADGTRTTITIPAGKIGNDNPLIITDERWYSQDLQATVMSKHTDPRFGESSYQLTNIQRTEPPASMFQIPSGYTLETEPGTK